MIEVLLLRFDAPMMSFGSERVDQHGFSDQFPGTSLLTGLLANALGWSHRDADRLQSLQERLVHAARQDRAGIPLRDYQTVDLGQDHLLDTCAWTTRGRRERRGGAASLTTHQRFRDYLAGAAYTVAVTLDPATEPPVISDLAEALQRPARPLFIGRKPCLPAAPLLIGVAEAPGLLAALIAAPVDERRDTGRLQARWPAAEPLPPSIPETDTRIRTIWDRRDWYNQIHSGRRLVREGLLPEHGAEVSDA
jgi:CRISPR system Cascade subunit CasD